MKRLVSILLIAQILFSLGAVSFADTYTYHGIEIPVGIGQPELSDEEMDALIASDDPAVIADSIHTLADCLYYFVRADFVFGDGLIEREGTCSAQQTMKRRIGQCASMSSAVNYILWGDYDEVGYIYVDGHVMVYIYTDGIYYAVNPVSYARQEKYCQAGERRITYYPETSTYFSENFQEIADGLVRDFKTQNVYTFSWPYSVFMDIPYRAPYGYTVKTWTGMDPQYTDYNSTYYANDRFVDESKIVMYLSDLASVYGSHYERENLPYYRGW